MILHNISSFRPDFKDHEIPHIICNLIIFLKKLSPRLCRSENIYLKKICVVRVGFVFNTRNTRHREVKTTGCAARRFWPRGYGTEPRVSLPYYLCTVALHALLPALLRTRLGLFLEHLLEPFLSPLVSGPGSPSSLSRASADLRGELVLARQSPPHRGKCRHAQVQHRQGLLRQDSLPSPWIPPCLYCTVL